MSEELEFISPVIKGRFEPSVSLQIKNALQGMEGKRIYLKLKEYRKKRSQSQNAFYFSQIVPRVRQHMLKVWGQNLSLEETHDMIVKHIWKFTKWVDMPDGTRCEVRRSSTEADTINWEEKVELTRAYFAADGLQLPMPNEILPV
jgi:hypothetical protein